MSIPQYGDYQFDVYFDGLEGQLPKYPVDFASLERKAAETLPSWVHSYVAGGCGDEGTQVKRALCARITENLGAAGVRGDDILINLVEMPRENWSFGRGELSYPPALATN